MKTIHFSFPHGIYLPLLACFLAALSNVAWAAVGQFQFVSGDVRIVASDGRERQAQKGGEINEGESIVSARGATAQLRMSDGGILAIRQDSQIHIDEYRFNGQEDGSERSFFSLVKGGLRSITGTVGKLNKENYRIKTPAATIGIRGTDSETIHISTAAGQGQEMPAGTYNRVNTGATVVNGTMVLPNQVAYTPNLGTPATLLPQMPAIFEPPKAPQTANKNTRKSENSGDTKNTPASTKPLPPPPDSTATASVAPPPPPAPTTTLVGTPSAVIPSGGTRSAPFGYGGVGADISLRTECPAGGPCYTAMLSGGGSMVLEPGTSRTILLNSGGFPVLIAETNSFGSMQYTSGTAVLLDFGQMPVAGTTVRWGRYVGRDSFIDNMGTRDPLAMNMMWADNALSFIRAQTALTSAQNLSLVPGAGTVVDELNNVYHLVNGKLLVSADGASIKLSVTTDTVASRSWDLTYQSSAGALAQFYQDPSAAGPGGLPLVTGSIKVNGTVVPTSYSGQASGVFIGSTANGALASFAAYAEPVAALPHGAALSGTALFK